MKILFLFSVVYFLNVQTCFCVKGSDDNFKGKNTINGILERLKAAEKQIQVLQKTISAHQDNGNKKLNLANTRSITNGNTAIGFTACLSVSGDVKYERDQTIIFDKVFTNVGHGYNSHSGVFTAPRRGLYVFHLAAMARSETSKLLDLVKDGNRLDTAYVGAHGAIDYQSVSKEWALQLEQGSQVWIKEGSYHGDIIDGWCKTAFTGYMVGAM
ncbi:cerebellin-1-like [Ruditapes philippinarum]|uniref:cerebellin-1-like n=1 Tax=Ruditapes philippinarum TaxID=129788 RepID=UPI00295B3F06|nr:cerebellin-1-like [Ruditapes philippinarum]